MMIFFKLVFIYLLFYFILLFFFFAFIFQSHQCMKYINLYKSLHDNITRENNQVPTEKLVNTSENLRH